MIGEVSWDAKMRRVWASWYSILSGILGGFSYSSDGEKSTNDTEMGIRGGGFIKHLRIRR
jgi:hypothetical protein